MDRGQRPDFAVEDVSKRDIETVREQQPEFADREKTRRGRGKGRKPRGRGLKRMRGPDFDAFESEDLDFRPDFAGEFSKPERDTVRPVWEDNMSMDDGEKKQRRRRDRPDFVVEDHFSKPDREMEREERPDFAVEDVSKADREMDREQRPDFAVEDVSK